jgi:isocitrate dehydrogenase kinase/phosphatase
MNELLLQEAPGRAAQMILDAFEEYRICFAEITSRARNRFINRDWTGGKADALERLDLYAAIVKETVDKLKRFMGHHLNTENIGVSMKSIYSEMVLLRDDTELAETFFNSIMRKVFSIVGMIPSIEFTTPDFKIPLIQDRACLICKTHFVPDSGISASGMIEKMLDEYKDELLLADIAEDSKKISLLIEKNLIKIYGITRLDCIEVVEAVFYRQKAAYIIGRIRSNTRIVPLIIAFLNLPDKGVRADAVLLTDRSTSIIFGFTRSYFHVMVPRPSEMINFLKSLLPNKRVSEIYTSIGFHKHGKSELFRELTRSLERSNDRFETAQGEKGMVMLVFTLPSFDVVFKIIKDHFEYPKKTHRQAVKDCYRLVFRHNRVGRLIDAQVFELLEFEKRRFTRELLEELEKFAKETVIIGEKTVTIKHLFTERRIRPLDLYIREESEDAAKDAVIDYGYAIKELAACNIFPGDLFLKNFGVTRNKRVVFYDYDEISLVTDCNFRKIPRSRGYDDELSSEPWYFVGDHDIFPEEFQTFIHLPGPLKEVFEKAHGDLYTVEFWQNIKERIEQGVIMHIFPYERKKRFKYMDWTCSMKNTSKTGYRTL